MSGNSRQEVKGYTEERNLNDKEAKRFSQIEVVSVRTFSSLPKMAQQKKSFCCHCYLGLI